VVTLYWLELVVESGLIKPERLGELLKEGNEIVSIVTASRKTAKARLRR
jgi:hypothetical protein